MPKIALHWQILIGLALGIVVGIGINVLWTSQTWEAIGVGDAAAYLAGAEFAEDELNPNEDAGIVAWTTRWVGQFTGFIGDLFMRMLRFIAVPIVLFSLIVGASSLNDLAKLSRIGGKTVGIYLVTTAFAITVGLLFANLAQPGNSVSEEKRAELLVDYGAQATSKIEAAGKPSGWDVLLNLVPKNPFEAIATGQMLQVVVAALLVGIALTLIPKKKAGPVIAFFDGMTDVIIKIVEVVMRVAPYAVFALIVPVIATMGLEVLKALSVYALVVVAALCVMMFGLYPLILKIFTPVGYGRFFKAISPAQLLAFSSSSSSATLPVTMECCEERLGAGEEVTSFVVPVGATINMDGTALYQGVAAVFIAQLYNMDLSLADQLTIVLTATLASIGTAGVPGVGIIMLVIVLESVGIPLEGIAFILGVDRLLDMCRTSCNVTGDCMVCAVVASTEKELLTPEQVEERARERAAKGLDEHPHEKGSRQYDVPVGSPSRGTDGDLDKGK